MSEVFVTLFDSLFLPQGLALYHSLAEHLYDFELVVICLDLDCYEILQRLNFKNLIPVKLSDLECNQLLNVKKSRSRREYCWTLTPFSIQWTFDLIPFSSRVTYIDADIFFLKSPEQIFTDFETSGKAFLITEHSYSPFYDQTISSGRYCVQFIIVSRDKGSKALSYWRDSCLDWCFARHEDGKFGDQKYIEDIANMFKEDVIELKSDPRFLAPWNMDIYRYSDAILFHFHEFRILSKNLFILTQVYSIPAPVYKHVYKSYIFTLKALANQYHSQGVKLRMQSKVTLKLLIKISSL